MSLRYYLHIGGAKIDMLFQQVDADFGRKCTSVVGVVVKFLSAERAGEVPGIARAALVGKPLIVAG